jgi:hypothetical protein
MLMYGSVVRVTVVLAWEGAQPSTFTVRVYVVVKEGDAMGLAMLGLSRPVEGDQV